MFEIDSYAKQFADIMSDGLIFIDTDGTIQIYNNKAREIFGVVNNYVYSHSSGKIEIGDIVIIGDSCIGLDDGELTPKNLKCIGIDDANIETRDAIIAIGSYCKDKSEFPKYVINKYDNYIDKLELSCVYSGVSIMA